MVENKAYELVITYIKQGILKHTFELGDRLPSERELSVQLGVSRNSVREALRTLGIMGVIASRRGAGNYISDDLEKSLVESMSMMYAMNKIDNEQISEYRYALEMRALSLAFRNVTEDEIEAMERCIRMIDESKSDEEKAKMDKRFHDLLVKASRNWIFIENIAALNQVIDCFIRDMRSTILQNERDGKRLQEAHWSIINALKEKDEAKGMAALHDHFVYLNEEIARRKN